MPRPGQGKPPYKTKNRGEDYNQDRKFPDYKAAWVDTKFMQASILLGPEKDNQEDEDRDVVLAFMTPGNMPNLFYKLGEFTEEELEAAAKLITTALEWARPVARRRDQEAQVALENGDDTIDRLYRPIPSVVFRQRKVGEYFERVQLRPAGVSASGRRTFEPDSDGSVRGTGHGMAEHDSRKDEAKDHAATAHESEAVREVGRDSESAERVHGAEGIEDDSSSDR